LERVFRTCPGGPWGSI